MFIWWTASFDFICLRECIKMKIFDNYSFLSSKTMAFWCICLIFIYFTSSQCVVEGFSYSEIQENGHVVSPINENNGDNLKTSILPLHSMELSSEKAPLSNSRRTKRSGEKSDPVPSEKSQLEENKLGQQLMSEHKHVSTISPITVETSNSTGNVSVGSTTSEPVVDVTNATSTISPADPVLPDKGSAEEEHNSSMSIFFVLCVLALGILLIHFMLQKNFQYLPESIAIVFLGGLIGLILNLMSNQNIANWRKEEAFSPTAFFLVLLPPIIFESGYNLHKGNFFQNIGSILVFAIIGTTISALVIGAGVYILGLAKVAYQLSFVESFAFGSLISAVDPVATVAIFHAMDVDPVLNMLVFGESILNDAVAIVLTTSILESSSPTMTSTEAVLTGFNRFCLMFFASAGIGVAFALVSALLLKHVDLRKNPSLELGIMLVFTYAPYALAEGIHLSGKVQFLSSKIINYLVN